MPISIANSRRDSRRRGLMVAVMVRAKGGEDPRWLPFVQDSGEIVTDLRLMKRELAIRVVEEADQFEADIFGRGLGFELAPSCLRRDTGLRWIARAVGDEDHAELAPGLLVKQQGPPGADDLIIHVRGNDQHATRLNRAEFDGHAVRYAVQARQQPASAPAAEFA